jgi:hypothetical protein
MVDKLRKHDRGDLAMDVAKIARLLNLAGDPSANTHEAINALQTARRMVREIGSGFEVLFSRDNFENSALQDEIHKAQAEAAAQKRKADQAIRAAKERGAESTRLKQIISAQQEQLEASRARCVRLESQVELLQAKVHARELEAQAFKSDCGRVYVQFSDFAASATKCFRRARWKSAFAFEANMTLKMVNAWETVGLMPAEFASYLKGLSPEQLKNASRQPWTREEVARLAELVPSGESDSNLAHLLSREFGRRIFESAVTTQRRRLRRENAHAGEEQKTPIGWHVVRQSKARASQQAF